MNFKKGKCGNSSLYYLNQGILLCQIVLTGVTMSQFLIRGQICDPWPKCSKEALKLGLMRLQFEASFWHLKKGFLGVLNGP